MSLSGRDLAKSYYRQYPQWVDVSFPLNVLKITNIITIRKLHLETLDRGWVVPTSSSDIDIMSSTALSMSFRLKKEPQQWLMPLCSPGRCLLPRAWHFLGSFICSTCPASQCMWNKMFFANPQIVSIPISLYGPEAAGQPGSTLLGCFPFLSVLQHIKHLMIIYRVEVTSLSTQGKSMSASLFPELHGEAWRKLSNIDYALTRGGVPEGFVSTEHQNLYQLPHTKISPTFRLYKKLDSPPLISYSSAQPSSLQRITFVPLPHPSHLAHQGHVFST